MKRILLTGILVGFLAACGGDATSGQDAAPEKPAEITAPQAKTEASNSERQAVVTACQRFETKTVCNCIADTMEETFSADQFASVSGIMAGGTILPDAIKSKLDPDGAAAFDTAMTAWNETCELN